MKKYEILIYSDDIKLQNNTIYFLLKYYGYSENFIKHLRITPNSIMLNEKNANLKSKISNFDKIKILNNPYPATVLPEDDEKLEILYEDDDYLIVNKPHLLACMPTRSHFYKNLGAQICTHMKNKDENFVLRIVNRLDKDTAGIVVVAKNISAYNSKLTKEYHAICEGNLPSENFTINKPILTITENGINKIKRIISEKGKIAITRVKFLKKLKDNLNLISLKLETGRTHQIRVHLSSENCPLLDDSIYNPNFNPESHTYLILKKLSFTHCRTQKDISIEIKYPQDWTDLLK